MQLILISHGDFCQGLKQTAEMIVGEMPTAQTVSLYPEESVDDFQQKFETALNHAGDGEIVVLCDIMGGTPCNVAMRYLDRIKGLYSGMNLPMVISLVSEESTDSLLNDAKTQIYDVRQQLASLSLDDE